MKRFLFTKLTETERAKKTTLMINFNFIDIK